MRTHLFRNGVLFVLAAIFLLACDLAALTGGSAKPTIVIQAPANASQFHEGDEIAIQSAATDTGGIASIDLFVDGAAARTDRPQAAPGGNLFTLTQKWKATAGMHTLSVRAYNSSGVASDLATVTISVAPAAAQLASPTLTPPPVSASTAPTATSAALTATLPVSSNITFKFDDGVTAEQRQVVQKGIALAQQYFGDAGPLSVSAYSNLDALINESSQYYKRAADGEASKNIKQHLQSGTWVAYAEGDAMWLWVSTFKMWQPAYIQYAWQLVAHEYFHAVQNYTSKKTGNDQAPLWLREGSAEYGSYVVVANTGLIDLNRLSKAKIERTRGILNPLNTMETLQGAEAEDTETPYSLGFVTGQFLAANYGEPALLKKYWQARATSATWQDAFQSAFGVSVDDFYRKFEDYRRAQLPPYCGTVGEPITSTLTVTYDRQFPPGTLNFQDFIYSQWSPDATGYTFCVKGYPLATTAAVALQALKYPKDIAKLDSCGGSCWILYVQPGVPAGAYTFAADLPDGRHAEAQFQHTTAPAPGVVAQTPMPAATETPALPPGLYVSAVALDPPEPKYGQYPTFNVTFVNSTGQTMYFKWFVKIYEPDAKQSMGETAKVDSTFLAGSSTVSSAANWKAVGSTPCRQFIARVFYQAADKSIVEFPKPGGDNFWHYFSMCQ